MVRLSELSFTGDGDEPLDYGALAEAVGRMNFGALQRELDAFSSWQSDNLHKAVTEAVKAQSQAVSKLAAELPHSRVWDLAAAMATVTHGLPKVDLSGAIRALEMTAAVAKMTTSFTAMPASSVHIARLVLETQPPTREAMREFATQIESTPEMDEAVEAAAEALSRSRPGLSKAMARRLAVAYFYVLAFSALFNLLLINPTLAAMLLAATGLHAGNVASAAGDIVDRYYPDDSRPTEDERAD